MLDARPGGDAAPVAVISYDLWQGLFAADTTIIGDTVGIGGHSFTIIGVAPRGFRGIVQDWGGPPDLWIPLTHVELAHRIFWEKTKFRQNRQIHVFLACGRLKTGISLAQAQTTLETISKSLESTHPHTNTRQTIKLVPIGHARFWPTQRGSIMRFSLLLMGVGAVVLALASSNVAGLLLIRAAGRSKETAVRLALGLQRGSAGSAVTRRDAGTVPSRGPLGTHSHPMDGQHSGCPPRNLWDDDECARRHYYTRYCCRPNHIRSCGHRPGVSPSATGPPFQSPRHAAAAVVLH